MDDYTREMMDLKTLVTRTLEKKGVLAKIRVIFTFKKNSNVMLLFPSKFVSYALLQISHSYSLYCISSIFWGSSAAVW